LKAEFAVRSGGKGEERAQVEERWGGGGVSF